MSGRLPAVALAALAAATVAAVAVPGASDSRARPKASFTYAPSAPRAGRPIRFRSTGARCAACRYRWEYRRSARGTPRYGRLGAGRAIGFTFRSAGRKTVRLTVTDRRGRRHRRTRRIRVAAAAQTASPVLGRPSCEPGAMAATTAGQVRDGVRAGRDVCVTAPVGDVDLDGLQGSAVRHVGTSPAGALGRVHLEDASQITLRARIRSVIIRRSDRVTIERSVIGGTSAERILDQLVFIPEPSHDVTIRDSDIGWTLADDSGNTGFGIRAYNSSARLRIERNRIHHIGGDGIQLGMDGPDTVVDRNEIAFVAKPPGSDEHADDLQITGNGPNMRITNNYLHHNGWFTANGPVTGGSGPYIHAGDSAPLLFENNLVRDEANFMQVGNLGTGGCERSNLTFRRNTFLHNGTLFENAADLDWRLCGGSGNTFERNVVNDTFWNEYGFRASGTTARDNLVGRQYAIDAGGACTAAACDPAGEEPIGYRKPSGVHW